MKDQCSIPLLHVDDSIFTDSQERTNAFNDYFTSIFTQKDLSTVPTISGIPFPDVPPILFSVKGVAGLSSGLNHYKATGPNSILAYFLKELSNKLVPIDFSIISAPRASYYSHLQKLQPYSDL